MTNKNKHFNNRHTYIIGVIVSAFVLFVSLGAIYLQRYNDGYGMYVGSVGVSTDDLICGDAGILPGEVCTSDFHRGGGGMCEASGISVYTLEPGHSKTDVLYTFNPLSTCEVGVWVPSPLLELKLATQISTIIGAIAGALVLLFGGLLVKTRKA